MFFLSEDTKELIGLLAAILALGGYIPYLAGILNKRVKPHVFSWFIWALLTGIGFFAQIKSGGGPGSWATGLTAIACLAITILSLRHGEKNITRSDWVTFILSLSAIPLWLATKDPLWSVILISLIDVVAFWPTFRKSWYRPYEEATQAYFFSGIKFGVSLFALTTISWTTVLYPASLVIMNFVFVIMLLARRRNLSC